MWFDYSDAYILVKGRIRRSGTGYNAASREADERNERLFFKIFSPFSSCIGEVNYTDIDHAKDLGVIMQIYNLIKYSDNYSKTAETLWKYTQINQITT